MRRAAAHAKKNDSLRPSRKVRCFGEQWIPGSRCYLRVLCRQSLSQTCQRKQPKTGRGGLQNMSSVEHPNHFQLNIKSVIEICKLMTQTKKTSTSTPRNLRLASVGPNQEIETLPKQKDFGKQPSLPRSRRQGQASIYFQ